MSTHSKQSANIYYWFLASILLVTLVAGLTYYFSIPELRKARLKVDTLESELLLAENENRELEAVNVLLEQQFSIIRGANNRLMDTENEYQQEIAQLTNELAFYRRLTGASGKLEGLSMNKFLLEPTASERVFHFTLTLTQNLQKARAITGKIKLSIRGSLANQPALLDWQSLHPEDSAAPEFNFKYFQQIQAYLTLPDGFVPETIEITLNPANKPKVTDSFAWQSSFTEEGIEHPLPASLVKSVK